MTVVWVLIAIFSFVIIVTYIGEKEKTKRTRLKLEAMLREKEMEGGYMRGTYSDLGSRDDADRSDPADGKRMSRSELDRGIKDLEERLRNLDTIIRNRKDKE